MNYTTNYKLPQWVETDRIQMEDFNQMCADIDEGIAQSRGFGTLSLQHLRKIYCDLCRLTYQQDGKGVYTGWREGFDFDGLNTDHKVESTSGAAVLEPESGQVRLAVDGWTGGTLPFSDTSFALAAKETVEQLTEEWSPEGLAQLTTVAFSGKLSSGVTTSITVSAVLMCGDEEVAATNSGSIAKAGSTATLTFSSAVTIGPSETYRLKIVFYNQTTNYDQTVSLTSDITMLATAVKGTSGSFTSGPMIAAGKELMAWVQYSAPGSVTMEVLRDGAWTAMTLEQESDSETPEGATCTEGRFALTLSEEVSSVQLRVSINSESECMVYGYGVTAL